MYELTFVDLVSAIGAAQGLFLAFLLLGQKQRLLPNYLLALFIIAFVLLSIGDILYYSRLLLSFPHWWMVFDPLTFILAPLFYLYVLSLVKPGFALLPRHLAHALPALLLYVVLVVLYLQPADIKLEMLQQDYADAGRGPDIVLLLAGVQMLAYFMASFFLLHRHAAMIRNNYSSLEKVELRWLRTMTGGLIILWLCFVIASGLGLAWLKTLDRVVFPLAVYAIGYMSIRQPAIFRQKELVPADKEEISREPVVLTERRKYTHSTLMPETAAAYAVQLQELMEKERLYLQPDLKLQDIAEQLDVRIHYLSQVLNDNLGKSFFDFVNGYRVEEVKRKLCDPAFDNFTLLAIGLECGFNSKAAFNAAFKKHTSLTPSQYKRRTHTPDISESDRPITSKS